MALTQGSPLPDVTVTQRAATTAPDWYTNYLSNLASTGQGQVAQAVTDPSRMVAGFGALQQQGMQQLGQTAGTYAPYTQAAQQFITGAGQMSAAGAATPYISQSAAGSAAGAAQPYIQQATGLSPLAAAQPYLGQAAGLSAAQAAAPGIQGAMGPATAGLAQYMNPYTADVISEIGRLGQRNIQENLMPQAKAATVATGALGSQRGQQILGQTMREALADIGGRQAAALSQGYTQALGAAQTDLARQLQAAQAAGALTQADAAKLAQLGATAGGLQGQQASNLLQAAQATGQLSSADLARLLSAGQATGQLTGADISSRLAAGQQMGALGQTAQAMNLADVNALATIGAQQQALEQARINAPLITAANAAQLLRGYTVPTSTEQVYKGPMPGAYSASPLQQVAGLGALFASGAGGVSPVQGFTNFLKNFMPSGGGTTGGLTYNPGAGYGTGTTSTGLNIYDQSNYTYDPNGP